MGTCSWFAYLICTLQLVVAQSTVQRSFADGSYCLHCSGANPLEALGCDLAFIFSGCFFGALLGDLGTCGVPTYSAASGKSCYSLGSCGTSCTGSDASGYYLDYCCFLPGSPFLDPYLTGSPPPTSNTFPSPTTALVPSPTASSKGISCDIVDTLANQYAITSASGPDANGYYGQVLNLACLRSTCPNPACQRVAAVRSVDPDCANYGGSFDFEQNVFGKFTKDVNLNKVAQDAAQFQKIGEIVSVALDTALVNKALQMPPPQRIFLLALTRSGFTDSKTIATVAAGISHFQNDLGPNFDSYIRNLVASSPDDATLAAKISALKAEHDLLFKCAVVPGFDAQAANGELPLLPALAADIAVPIAAQLVRDVDLYNALRDIKGASIPEAIAGALGIKLPSVPSLQWDPRNWIDTSGLFRRDLEGRLIGSTTYSQKGMTTSLTEISITSGTNIVVSLELASSFKVNVDNSKPSGEGCMARAMLVYPSTEQPPRSPTVFKIEGNDVSIIGPIGSIYPASYQMVFYNTSHIIPSNISDPLIPVSSITNAPGAALKGPVSPLTDGTPLMYSAAIVSLSYNPVYVSGMIRPILPETDITIFDIITGLPLKSVSYVPDANGGVFSAPLQPGNGIWGGHWGSGGSFALGLKSNATSSSSSSFSTSSSSSISSTKTFSLSSSQTKSLFTTALSTMISENVPSNSIVVTSSSVSPASTSTSASSTGRGSFTPGGFMNSSSSRIYSSMGIFTSSNVEASSSTSRLGSTSTLLSSKTSTEDLAVASTSTSPTLVAAIASSGPIENNEFSTTIIIYTTTSICPIMQTLISGLSTITRSTYSLSTITVATTSTISCNLGCKAGAQSSVPGAPTAIVPGGGRSTPVMGVVPTAVGNQMSSVIVAPIAKSSSLFGDVSSNTPKLQEAPVSKATFAQFSSPILVSPAKTPTPPTESQNIVPTILPDSRTVTGDEPVATLQPLVLKTSTTQASRANGSAATSTASYSGPAVTGSAVSFKASLHLLNAYMLCAIFIVGIIVL